MLRMIVVASHPKYSARFLAIDILKRCLCEPVEGVTRVSPVDQGSTPPAVTAPDIVIYIMIVVASYMEEVADRASTYEFLR